MGWTQLQPSIHREADIQGHFNTWQQPAQRRRRAGAPDWLEDLQDIVPQKHFSTKLGYGFYPDVLATSRNQQLVLELKCARKYEPLALAEALHHAWMLSHTIKEGGVEHGRGPWIPVLVTQYSTWLRAAVAQLRAGKLEHESLRYIELTTLWAGDAARDPLIWFDDPFTGWDGEHPVPPPALPVGLVAEGNWYHVKDTKTWICVKDPMKTRVAVWTVPYLMLTQGPGPEEILTWDGGVGGFNRYLLWAPKKGNDKDKVSVAL